MSIQKGYKVQNFNISKLKCTFIQVILEIEKKLLKMATFKEMEIDVAVKISCENNL